MTADDPDDRAAAAADEGERLDRLSDGLQRAEADRAQWARQRILAILAGVLAPAGVVLVLIGWHGASRTPNVHEQIPYLISGGELGQTLALLGAILYFAHWLTTLVREQRAQGAAIVAAITHLETVLVDVLREAGPGRAGAEGGPVVPALVATARGGLAHDPSCSAVAGRAGLRTVTPTDDLPRCRLCLPTG